MGTWSLQDIANKADWEGGLLEFTFGYHCPATLAEIVDTSTPEGARFKELVEMLVPMEAIINEMNELLPDPGDD